MKLLFICCLAMIAVQVCAETESEKTYRLGVPGTYGRLDGMVYYSIRLRSDGTYTFSESDCLTSDRNNGKWGIHGDIVSLDRKQAAFTHFRICAIEQPRSLALLPLEDDAVGKDDPDERRLFKAHEEKTANQSAQPPQAPGPRG